MSFKTGPTRYREVVMTSSHHGLVISGGESVLVNGAVFKTVSETVRAGSGRFDSYTPPPKNQKAVGRKQ